MTVAELIAKLQEMPQDADVIANTVTDGWMLEHDIIDAVECFGGAVQLQMGSGGMAEGR